MNLEARVDRRLLLGGALAAPAIARGEAALPAFSQNGRQFVFVSPQRAVPDVALPTSEGGSIRIAEPDGRAGLIYFGATWCPPCARELAGIESRLAGPGPHPRVLAVLTDSGGAGAVKPFLRRAGLKRPVALDPTQQVARTVAAARPEDVFVLWALPITYAVSPRNRVVGYLPGAIDWTRPDVAAFLGAFAAM